MLIHCWQTGTSSRMHKNEPDKYYRKIRITIVSYIKKKKKNVLYNLKIKQAPPQEVGRTRFPSLQSQANTSLTL